MLNRGLETLALLHINGLSHGNSELKNLAISPHTQKHWIIDMEYGVSFLHSAQKIASPTGVISKINQDLRQLGKSLLDHKIIDSTQTNKEICEQNLQLILIPYAQIINQQASNIGLTKIIQNNINTIITLLTNEFFGETPNRSNVESNLFTPNK